MFDCLDLRAGAVEHVKQKRLKHVGRKRHCIEVERLKCPEREGILDIVEQMSELAGSRPALEQFSQWADHRDEVGERATLGVELVDALDCRVQAALLGRIQSVFAAALDQHPHE